MGVGVTPTVGVIPRVGAGVGVALTVGVGVTPEVAVVASVGVEVRGVTVGAGVDDVTPCRKGVARLVGAFAESNRRLNEPGLSTLTVK